MGCRDGSIIGLPLSSGHLWTYSKSKLRAAARRAGREKGDVHLPLGHWFETEI